MCFTFCVSQLEKCSQDLGSNTKAVSSAIAQLLSEATQGNENYTGNNTHIITLLNCSVLYSYLLNKYPTSPSGGSHSNCTIYL